MHTCFKQNLASNTKLRYIASHMLHSDVRKTGLQVQGLCTTYVAFN